MRVHEIPVPFSEEEIERLTQLAAEDGGTIVEFIRARVFQPFLSGPTGMLARIEAARIQGSGKRRRDND